MIQTYILNQLIEKVTWETKFHMYDPDIQKQ